LSHIILNDILKTITDVYNSFCDESTGDETTGHFAVYAPYRVIFTRRESTLTMLIWCLMLRSIAMGSWTRVHEKRKLVIAIVRVPKHWK